MHDRSPKLHLLLLTNATADLPALSSQAPLSSQTKPPNVFMKSEMNIYKVKLFAPLTNA
jgi:hypothetical protein